MAHEDAKRIYAFDIGKSPIKATEVAHSYAFQVGYQETNEKLKKSSRAPKWHNVAHWTKYLNETWKK